MTPVSDLGKPMPPSSNQTQSQSQGVKPSVDSFEYPPIEQRFDEAWQTDGKLATHWQDVLSRLQGLGSENLRQRQQKSHRILRDDGATYKPYSKQEQHWLLDAVPLVLESTTWATIEKGLLQRAELFNRLFQDIYSSQEIIRQGVVPPEAIFAHPGFIRPCFQVGFPSEQHALLLYAADMVRTQSNEVCIIGDRTQAPSGAGFALENRTVMTRVFPSLFKDSQVHRLAMFFNTMRLKLNALSPNEELPNIVVLSPGSLSESYFEHAHLANYLGYTLVQGRDLVVRNGYVYTKSLSGLRRVDVILRRVDDFYCDPVELKSDSYLGVPGLLEVVRAGKVAVANPLGSGILENPVFLKYLDNINQAYGFEPLSIKTVPTWWAFDPLDREYIFDNLQHLIIKPVFRRFVQHAIWGASLNESELDNWRKVIQKEPHKYVAQSYVAPGLAPAWQEEQFSPRPIVLRSFVVAGQDKYSVMPGGLTRQGESLDDKVITSHDSQWSKDTWVLSDQPVSQASLWSETSPQDLLKEQPQDLPSRVIENMFWLGRYSVRAEYALRLLRTVFLQLNNTHQLSESCYQMILKSVTHVTETYPGFTADDSILFEKPDAELISIIIDSNRSGSVSASLFEMLSCAEEVKVQLSADTQRVINDIRDNVNLLKAAIRHDFASAPEEALDPLVTSLLAFSGLLNESMIRGYGWRFIEIGRCIERAYQTTSLLDALLKPDLTEQDTDFVLETVLLTLETLITYRRRYQGRANVLNGLELILLDETNPRSLNYILQKLNDHMEHLPQEAGNRFLTKECRVPLELLNKIQLGDLSQLASVNSTDKERTKLHSLLIESQDLLNELATVLRDRYFDHTETQHLVTQAFWEEDEV